jgi:hypothetical protein
MSGRATPRPTDEQIAALINKYSNNDAILELFYIGPVNTCIRLETALKYGVSVNTLAYTPIVLPEYENGSLPSQNITTYLNQQKIVKTILSNFISNNPQYFHKVTATKYAISDAFVLDILLHHRQRGFDPVDLSSIFPYLTSLEIFTIIVKAFYLPFRNDETFETLKRKHFQRRKPYKFRKRALLFASPAIGEEGITNA